MVIFTLRLLPLPFAMLSPSGLSSACVDSPLCCAATPGQVSRMGTSYPSSTMLIESASYFSSSLTLLTISIGDVYWDHDILILRGLYLRGTGKITWLSPERLPKVILPLDGDQLGVVLDRGHHLVHQLQQVHFTYPPAASFGSGT